MLQLNNINIAYNKKILECQNLFFPSVGLCIIKGQSGSGKTSLIRCLTMETQFYDSYLYNHQPVTEESVKEKMSILNQEQEFIDEMTVRDHIKIIENVYSFSRTNDYILKLDLQPLLDKYPNQLSGGEKTRVSLLLRIMKQAEILILDEPTASLDLNYTHIVLDIIKEYAQSHLVIVCSHDEEIIKEKGILYEIKDKTIISNSMENDIEKSTCHKKEYHSIRFPIMKLNLKLKKRYKYYYIGFFSVIAVLILLSSFGISLHLTSENNADTFASVYQNEILVYKGDEGLSGWGYEYPLTKAEIDSIKDLKYVSHAEETYIYKALLEIVKDEKGELNFAGEDILYVSLWNHDQEIKKVNYQTSGYSDTLSYCSYDENIDYSQDIAIQFQNHKNGIYVSKSMADMLGIDETKNDYYLEFSLMIPTHQIYGDAIIPYQNEDGTYGPEGKPVLEWMGHKEKVKLPINGILKSSNMGVGINQYLSLFFSNQYIQSYIEKYRNDKTINYYWLDSEGKYVRTVPEGQTSSKMIVAKPYEPIIYRLHIDNLTHLETVEQELKKQGFSTLKGDYSPTVKDFANNTDQMIMMISVFLFVILTLVYGVIHYLRHAQEQQIKKFIESFGIRQSNQFIMKKYFMDFYILDIIIFIIAFIYLCIIGPFMNYPIHYAYSFIPIALLLSFLIMVMIPFCVYKLRK